MDAYYANILATSETPIEKRWKALKAVARKAVVRLHRVLNDEVSMPDIRIGRYRHYKGNEYTVLGVVRHSETRDELVLYRQEYGDHSLWVRPLAMFQELVEIGGEEVPRFKFLGESLADES